MKCIAIGRDLKQLNPVVVGCAAEGVLAGESVNDSGKASHLTQAPFLSGDDGAGCDVKHCRLAMVTPVVQEIKRAA
jgi:hypothetical protein